MPSSITTAIPTSPIEKWCIAAVEFYGGDRYECANETLGYRRADFQTFCCNGDVLDSQKDIWRPHAGNNDDDASVHLSDMLCCGLDGAQAGGIHPLPTAYTACSEGSPTPLASLAGTNTDNAVPYLVTYTSASYGDGTVGDYVPTATPTCFWAYTVGAGMQEVTLPAPDIETLPPATTDAFGFPIESSTTTAKSGGIITSSSTATGAGVSSQGSGSETSSVAAAAASTSTPSSAALARAGGSKRYIGLCLGLVAASLFWS
ncbi:adenine phosphoribosyltransferase [Hypoxylon texense]